MATGRCAVDCFFSFLFGDFERTRSVSSLPPLFFSLLFLAFSVRGSCQVEIGQPREKGLRIANDVFLLSLSLSVTSLAHIGGATRIASSTTEDNDDDDEKKIAKTRGGKTCQGEAA